MKTFERNNAVTNGEMGTEMKFRKAATVLAVAGILLGSVSIANAANKTITCYKGTTVKKVTGANPKCPAGYTTTAPKASAPAAKGGAVAIDATYKGTIATVWGSQYSVTVTSLTATGSGATGGLNNLSATGSAKAAGVSQDNLCTSDIDATATLGTGADTLKVKFVDGKTNFCAKGASEDPPYTIYIDNGPLMIVSGTGKYAGATGTLNATGSWTANTVTKGTKDSSAITLNIKGTLTTK